MANVRGIQASSNTGNGTLVDVYADPTTHALLINSPGGASAEEVKITDGTNITNVLKSDGTAAGQNALLTANGMLAVSFTTTTVQAVASTDAGNYSHVAVQITSQGGSSTVTFQTSNDNSNWVSVALQLSSSAQTSPTSSSTTTGIYVGPVPGRYFRLNVTGIASGTTAGVVEFFTNAKGIHAIGGAVAQAGTWTVQPGNTANTTPWLITGGVASGATDSGNPVKMGGVNNTTQPTFTDGQRGDLQIDTRGNLKTVLYGKDGVNNVGVTTAFTDSQSNATNALTVGSFPRVYNGSTWDRQPGDATKGTKMYQSWTLGRATADTQIKATAGFIHTVSIAPLTATPTAGLLTIYDSAAESGTVLYSEWIFATTPGHTVTLDLATTTGIYVGFDGSLANVQVTVSYQ